MLNTKSIYVVTFDITYGFMHILPLITTCDAPMALAANKETSPIGPIIMKTTFMSFVALTPRG